MMAENLPVVQDQHVLAELRRLADKLDDLTTLGLVERRAIELAVAQLNVVEIVLRHMWMRPATDDREIRDRVPARCKMGVTAHSGDRAMSRGQLWMIAVTLSGALGITLSIAVRSTFAERWSCSTGL
jgi:hypothetical protein